MEGKDLATVLTSVFKECEEAVKNFKKYMGMARDLTRPKKVSTSKRPEPGVAAGSDGKV